MGEIYRTTSATPGGLPIYFYPLLIAIKTPLAVLAAFLVGLALSVRRRSETGSFFLVFMFVIWFVPYSIFAGKFFRYTLTLRPSLHVRRDRRRRDVPLPRAQSRDARSPFRHRVRDRPLGRRHSARGAFSRSSRTRRSTSTPSGAGHRLLLPTTSSTTSGFARRSRASARRRRQRVVYAEAPPVFQYYQNRFGRSTSGSTASPRSVSRCARAA